MFSTPYTLSLFLVDKANRELGQERAKGMREEKRGRGRGRESLKR
jgi:hypothetical protein